MGVWGPLFLLYRALLNRRRPAAKITGRHLKVIKDSIKEIVEDARPAIKDAGFRLVEFNHASINHGRTLVLKFVIDKFKKNDAKDGITHGDCIKVTKLIEEEIGRRFNAEELDYTIEVASFGLGRAFASAEDYEANMGIELEVRLNKKINDFFKFSGVLREIIYEQGEASAISIELTEMGDKKIAEYLKKKKKDAPAVEVPSHITIPLSAVSKTSVKIHF